MLCSNRPEGFGPLSQLYSHILTSCFIDTILVPLCTWLYLFTVLILLLISSTTGSHRTAEREYTPGVGFKPARTRFGRGARRSSSKRSADVDDDVADGHGGGGGDVDMLALPEGGGKRRSKAQLGLSILYFLLLLAQIAMCVLEIARLSLADLGIGLLPFTIVTLLVAGLLRLTRGLGGRVRGWRWANLGVWVALAATEGVKLAGEIKEGTDARKATKYPEADEITDVAVMIGVYVVLSILELVVR